MTVPADPPTASAPQAPPADGRGLPTPAAGPTPAARSRRRWWVVGAVAGWAVLLVVLSVLSVRRDPPTVPDQLDLADAVPAVDRAAGAVLAATAADAVVEFGPLVVTRNCRITPVRDGAEATRDVTVHVRRGDAPATLRTLADALPPSFAAEVGRGGTGARQVLRADAGDFVAVRGTADDDGDVVSLRASTGCRPDPVRPHPGGPPGTDTGTDTGTGTGTDTGTGTGTGGDSAATPAAAPPGLVAVLDALGRADRLRAAGALSRWELRCPQGAVARTTTVDDAGPARRDLDRALDRLTGDATVVQGAADRYAYRRGAESVVVTDVNGRLRVTTATAC